jgi:hypothetical protein
VVFPMTAFLSASNLQDVPLTKRPYYGLPMPMNKRQSGTDEDLPVELSIL